MIYIYVLKLEGNKYYVGKTTNPQFRLENHFCSSGSKWTKKYTPLKLHELIPDQSNHDEQRITQEYMAKYGIDNVRGGPWCKLTLEQSEKTFIQQLLSGENDTCFQCGSADHFVGKCPVKSRACFCSKCGRNGHVATNCYAKTTGTGKRMKKVSMKQDVWNCKFCDRAFDSKKGCSFHENVHCIQRKGRNKQYDPARALVYELRDFSSDDDYDDDYDDDDYDDDDYEEDDYYDGDSYEKSVQCFRCGRQGHYANKCYAKTHTKGYYL